LTEGAVVEAKENGFAEFDVEKLLDINGAGVACGKDSEGGMVDGFVSLDGAA
jgi:hypothetical protein